MKYYSLLVICFFCTANLFSQGNFKKEINIQFINTVGKIPLQLNEMYTNDFEEKFTVSSFRYYISNITLVDEKNNSTNYFKDQYFLIDQSDNSSQNIVLLTSLKEITQISFMIGIDSMKNVQGVQTGILDPAKGMFWVWNTGYVMAKLEGNSNVVNTPRHAFSLHIGGFKTGQNTARIIHLSFSKNMGIIKINTDINHWFKSIHDLPLKENFFCHEPGILAMKYADNYETMFSIQENN
ncbi:MAG: MbnP family protein [Bacteroidota bacterium]